MAPLKVDSSGNQLYNPPSQLILTCIHIIGGDPYHLLDGDHDTAYEGRE